MVFCRIESTFPEWLDKFFETIEKIAPSPPPETMPRLENAIPPPRIRLQPVSPASIGSGSTIDPIAWAPDVRWAKIKKIERVTGEEWFQDVRSIDLSFEEAEPFQ